MIIGKKNLYIIGLALSFLAFPAQAAVVSGEKCDQLGTSTMTTDQKNIATCLKDDSGKLIWKSMTSADSGQGTWCGYAKLRQVNRNSSPTPVTYYLIDKGVTCGDQVIATCLPSWTGTIYGPGCSLPGQTFRQNCPSGFSLKTVPGTTTSSQNCNSKGNVCYGTTAEYYVTCIKD